MNSASLQSLLFLADIGYLVKLLSNFGPKKPWKYNTTLRAEAWPYPFGKITSLGPPEGIPKKRPDTIKTSHMILYVTPKDASLAGRT